MRGEKGFVLLLAVILLFLVAGLVATVYIELMGNRSLVRDVEAQLYSQALAENGIEYALAILPHLSLDEILAGEDGMMSSSHTEWRNPTSLREARVIDPDLWASANDDGLPVEFPYKLTFAGKGTAMVRFSNNPEETRDYDRDDVVLVRSLGVVPGADGGDPFSTGVRNHTSLVEARLRQERAFEAQSPLMLVGASGEFEFSGSRFRINSSESAAIVSLSTQSDSELEDSLRASLEDMGGRLETPGRRSIDLTETYAQDSRYRRLFSSKFWDHFCAQIPRFACGEASSGSSDALVWSEGTAELGDHFRGILISQGPLTLRDVEIDGLLIHLGDEKLILEGTTRIRGAVWACDLSSIELASEGIRLALRDSVEIIFDATAIDRVLPLFPATLLQWRILFPEMEDS